MKYILLLLVLISLVYAQDVTPPVITLLTVGNDTNAPYATSFLTPQLDFITDENAECKFSLSNQSYIDMNVACVGSALSHNCTSSDLGLDGVKDIFLTCLDGAGNSHDTSNNFHVAITLDTPRPVISNIKPVGTINSSSIVLGVTTDKISHCKYDGSDISYANMADFTVTDSLIHNVTVVGLSEGGYDYYVLCEDTGGNLMGLASKINFTIVIPDNVPPGKITDLRVYNFTSTTVTLSWAAVGDDGNEGIVTKYVLKTSGSFIQNSDWDDATLITDAITPQSPGNVEFYTVTGLIPGEKYYFVIKAEDELKNSGSISDSVIVTLLLTDPAGGPLEQNNDSEIIQEQGDTGEDLEPLEETTNLVGEEEFIPEPGSSSDVLTYVIIGFVGLAVIVGGKFFMDKMKKGEDEEYSEDLMKLSKKYKIEVSQLKRLEDYIENSRKEEWKDEDIMKELSKSKWDEEIIKAFMKK